MLNLVQFILYLRITDKYVKHKIRFNALLYNTRNYVTFSVGILET